MPDFSMIGGVAQIANGDLRTCWWTRDEYCDAVVRGLGEDPDKRLVMRFEADLARIMAARTVGPELDDLLARYLADDYRQHDPKVGQGRAGLARWLREVGVHLPGTPPPPVALVSNGGVVSALLQVAPPDSPGFFIVTMFRVSDGKLAEHWGGGAS